MKIIVNKDISIKAFVIITLFAILMGLTLIYIATRGFINVNILKNYKKELAVINDYRIVDTKNGDSSESSWKTQVKYSYFVNGKQYEGKDILWWQFLFFSDVNAHRGDKIDIYYNINNPSQSEVYHISYVLILVGICFIVISSLSLRQRIKEEQ